MAIPYENQLLGAFVYALGYYGGQRGTIPAAANLLQQTPLDQVFGDLIVGADRCLALEFKRDRRAMADERRKWPDGSFRAAWANDHVQQVSVKAHFVVYAEPKVPGIELCAVPYVQCMVPTPSAAARLSMPALIDAMHIAPAAAKPALGVSPSVLMQYLQQLHAYKRRVAGGRTVADAAWLAVVHKGEGFQLVTASSLTQLLEPQRTRERPERAHDRQPSRDDHDLGR
jgi:hypothetical protein